MSQLKSPNEICQEIISSCNNKKTELCQNLDEKCQQKVKSVEDFYNKIIFNFEMARYNRQELCVIELGKIENLTIKPDNNYWDNTISCESKNTILYFLEYLEKKNYTYSIAFKTNYIKDPTSYTIYPKYIYSCCRKLTINLK